MFCPPRIPRTSASASTTLTSRLKLCAIGLHTVPVPTAAATCCEGHEQNAALFYRGHAVYLWGSLLAQAQQPFVQGHEWTLGQHAHTAEVAHCEAAVQTSHLSARKPSLGACLSGVKAQHTAVNPMLVDGQPSGWPHNAPIEA